MPNEANKMTDTCHDTCSRQSGRAVLGDIVHRLRRKANDVEKLMDMLPARPTPEQDQALWNIALEIERR